MIQIKSRDSLAIGRLRVDIDDFARLVRVLPTHGPAPSAAELRQVQRLLAYHRPREFSESILTGWAIESVVDFGG